MKFKNDNKNKQKNTITIDYENKKLSVFYFLPLLLIAGFVPLIVYAKYVDLTGTTQSLYWTGQQQYLDFFSYWKSWWVVALTAVALVFYIILYVQKKLPLKNLKQYYIPLGIYALFVIISTMFAIDKPTALWGFVDMYQGMFVLLSYVTITFLTINFVNNKRDVNLFVNAFLFLMIVEGIIGVGQYFGFDFFQTSIGKSLIIPGNLVVEDLSFSFGPKTIYGTLFNTNFVGSFATLMLPLSVAFLLGANTKKQRIITGIAVVLMIFIWIGCNSRAGYLGVAVSVPFTLWLFRKVIRKYWIGSAVLLMSFMLVLFGLNKASGGRIFDRLEVFNIKKQIEIIKENNDNVLKFEEIYLNKDKFSIKTNRETLNLRVNENKIFFLDEDFNELEIQNNGNKLTIKDRKYKDYRITIPNNYPGVSISRATYWNWTSVNFYISDGVIKILGSGSRIIDPIIAETFTPLDGLERIGSNRGYIWGRTIILLNKYIIKGSGPDNFPMAFPQDDIVAKINTFNDPVIVVDKPHNLFLQIATNTGILSLIPLLAIWIMYIISSLKLYSKITFDSLDKFIGASCVVSIIGYLVAGIFNDSIISVAPMFWIILGLGMSINIRLKNNIS
ncbi:O-antigen ligase family protein [Sedimentibacter hydroxybenzoicus DSM 7310]|uniref:O-antigen ligase family protein n=1 Tax=Sedimentibacter hydroxybenzoicus DSM 7310 TaxID=1123245 RepID=A0A974BKF0_SEDHY|nr:O-antigen ligase family protein [Sedimentibacter hydroxybenzoicus]NYB74501.1 O-antigen ligase family protein [Sedimentibacter hydroxybenzoicus DSM 7310]